MGHDTQVNHREMVRKSETCVWLVVSSKRDRMRGKELDKTKWSVTFYVTFKHFKDSKTLIHIYSGYITGFLHTISVLCLICGLWII